MELQIVAFIAVGILLMLVVLSPGAKRGRHPVHTMVGKDQHARRLQRATYSAQVAERSAPRPLRVAGEHVRPVAQMARPAPIPAARAPLTPGDEGWGPLQLPKPAAVPVRLDWARQTAESAQRNQGERYADGQVASLLGPARAS